MARPKMSPEDRSEGHQVLHRARSKAMLERAEFRMKELGYANRNEWYNDQLEKLAAKAPSTRKKARKPKPRKARAKKVPASPEGGEAAKAPSEG